ncbi:MAG TPA: hypothetical protein VGF89_10215 [Steroidobacteraceae bacterium]
MEKFVRVLAVSGVLAVFGAMSAVAAGSHDPAIGTWALNVEKSKFSPGPAPKSQTRTYEQAADGIKLSWTGVAADGSAMTGESTFKYDGKDYPITGSPNYDTLTLKRVNATTVKSAQKKQGKTIAWSTRAVSEHGKVLTLTSRGKDAKGAAYHDVAVYERQ